MSALRSDQDRVRNILHNTIVSLCENGLSFEKHLRIEGVIGITKDGQDVFIVHINQLLTPKNNFGGTMPPCRAGGGTKRAAPRSAGTNRYVPQSCRQPPKQKPVQKKAFQQQKHSAFQSSAVNSRQSCPPPQFSPKTPANNVLQQHAMTQSPMSTSTRGFNSKQTMSPMSAHMRSPASRPMRPFIPGQTMSPMSAPFRSPMLALKNSPMSRPRSSSQPVTPRNDLRQITWHTTPSMPCLERYSPEKSAAESLCARSPNTSKFASQHSPGTLGIVDRRLKATPKGESYHQARGIVQSVRALPWKESSEDSVQKDKSCDVILLDDDDAGSPNLPPYKYENDSPSKYSDKGSLPDMKPFIFSGLDEPFEAQKKEFPQFKIPTAETSQYIDTSPDELLDGIVPLPDDSEFDLAKSVGDGHCSPSSTLVEEKSIGGVVVEEESSSDMNLEAGEVDDERVRFKEGLANEAVLLEDSLDENFEDAAGTVVDAPNSNFVESGFQNEHLPTENDNRVGESLLSRCGSVYPADPNALQNGTADPDVSAGVYQGQGYGDQAHGNAAFAATSSLPPAISSAISYSSDQYEEGEDYLDFDDSSNDEDWQWEDNNEALSDPDWAEDEPRRKKSKSTPKKCKAAGDSGTPKQKIKHRESPIKHAGLPYSSVPQSHLKPGEEESWKLVARYVCNISGCKASYSKKYGLIRHQNVKHNFQDS